MLKEASYTIRALKQEGCQEVQDEHCCPVRGRHAERSQLHHSGLEARRLPGSPGLHCRSIAALSGKIAARKSRTTFHEQCCPVWQHCCPVWQHCFQRQLSETTKQLHTRKSMSRTLPWPFLGPQTFLKRFFLICHPSYFNFNAYLHVLQLIENLLLLKRLVSTLGGFLSTSYSNFNGVLHILHSTEKLLM